MTRRALPGVSIVVNNYDNGRFVETAIDSALAQDHPDCEVIVVDDASTDGSQELIRRYAGRASLVLRSENAGQVVALNDAWPLARHPIVIFLDSDDALLPHAASTVARLWRDGVAKIQYCMATIDASGRHLGHVAPKYPPGLDTATIRAEMLRTGTAPTAMGSGNAYARWLLERVTADGGMVPPPGTRFSMDTILDVNSPFYGEVVTHAEALALYRMHAGNDSRQLEMDAARFTTSIARFAQRVAYLEGRCRVWGLPFDAGAVAGRDVYNNEQRVAAARLEHPGRSGPAVRLLGGAIRALRQSRLPARQKLIRGTWLVLVAASPTPVARRLIELRFLVPERPPAMERLFSRLGLAPAAPKP